MSPTPARTSREAIVAAARDLLEEEGLDGVTMARVAERVGVRPPSLYTRVRDRGALLAAVADTAVAELGEALGSAERTAGDGPAALRLEHAARAFRGYARQRPRSVALVFAGLGEGLQPSVAAAADAARPLLRLAAELCGPDRALPAARALTAFAYGFCAMEHAGAFRFGGDVDEAFHAGVDALVQGFAARRASSGSGRD
jgi:AcrR family transcriptional regulator